MRKESIQIIGENVIEIEFKDDDDCFIVVIEKNLVKYLSCVNDD